MARIIMTKQQLIKRINKIIEEIAILEWTKLRAKEFINDIKNQNPNKKLGINYELIEGRTAWGIPVKTDTLDEAIKRLDELPVFEKYFLFIYTLYEQYLADNNDRDKDKNNVDLMKYRIIRNVLIHNNKIIRKEDVDEFDRLAKQYDPSLQQTDLDNKFNYKPEAELSLVEFSPDSLRNFSELVKNLLP